MTTPTYNCLFGTPNYGDPGALYTPTLDSGLFPESLPLTNLQDARPNKPARSVDALNTSTRCRLDLKTDRQVQVVGLPNAYGGLGIASPVSSAGKIRVLGVPSSLLFDYEAGDDIVARGGTFTRTPTTDVRAATYVDRNGVVKYAGENLALQSAAFGTTWVASNVTVTSNTVANPYDATLTAETLTASSGNGTVKQALGTLASAAFVFSVWLKRKTGSGNIDLTLDNGSTWTTKVLTAKWQRFYITQTLANPTVGIRIVTNADAVYAWGAQAEHGSTPTGYVPTTTTIQGAPRDGHFIGGVRHLLPETARTNVCVNSEAFGSWADDGVDVTSNSSTAPDGATTADTLAFRTGTNGERSKVCAFTGNGTKVVSIFLKAGTSATTSILLFDSSASATRGRADVTWSGGVPSVVSGGGGTVTVFAVVALGSTGWYRISFSAGSVVAANTNEIRVYPFTAASGATAYTVIAWGAQAEDATFPSSYIPTGSAAVTRNTDKLTYVPTFTPQALTVYAKITEQGSVNGSVAGVFSVGDNTECAAFYASGGKYNFKQNSTAGGSTSTAAAAPSVGDTVELRGVIASTGAATLGQSINGAAEVVAAAGGAAALDAAWNAVTLCVGGDNSLTLQSVLAIRAIRVAAGSQTLAYMQSIVYDSGYTCQYPTGATAETINRMNVGHELVIPSTQTPFRYLSVHVDDETNSLGYVDLGRLFVSGGIQPSINMLLGASQGGDDPSKRDTTDSGAATYTERAVARTWRFTIPNIPEAEGQTSFSDLDRLLGTSRQVYFFWNPTDTSADYKHRRSGLCTVRALSPLEYTNALYVSKAYELIEAL